MLKIKYLIIFIFILTADLHPQGESRIRNIVKYGGNIDFYPFEFIDESSQPRGFTIDLLKEISRKTGIQIEIELKQWDSIINSLRNKERYELTSLYYSGERSKFVDFCQPLLLTYDNLYINNESPSLNDISELANREVLVEKGGFISEYIKKSLPTIKLVEVKTEGLALQLLNRKFRDFAIVNYYSGMADSRRFGLENIHSESLIIAPREYGFAVMKNDSLLKSDINSALNSLMKDGTYDRLYKKWFIYDEESLKYLDYFKWAGIAALFLTAAVAVIFLWNRTLKREVKKKTRQLTDELEKKEIIAGELLKAKEEAERLSSVKSEFISQISHEIRTPMNVIASGYEFMKEEVLKDDQEIIKKFLDPIKFATKRLTRTIDLILNYSEAKVGSYLVKKVSLDIEKDVIDKLINEYGLEARDKNLEIIKIVRTDNCSIEVDEYSAIQIFANIIANAIKFTEKGSVTVLIERTENLLSVSVKDTGRGISDEFLHEIFTPFSQEEHGYSRRYDGNGLGLSLAYHYCRLNDAEIEVDSRLGEGSTFTVKFKI